ncbi:MAG: tetratricopeptide repeat protein, partial [Methanobacteriota archaeon]
QVAVAGKCVLFHSSKESFCSGCTVEEGDDAGIMANKCVFTLSKFDSWDEIELKRYLARTLENSKKNELSPENKTRLAETLSSILEYSAKMDDIARIVGSTYAYLGQNDQAMKSFELALTLKEDDTTALNNKGVLLARSGKIKDAITCYDEVTDLDPDNEKAWFNKGKAYIRLKEPSKGSECFKNVVEINPKNVSAWNNLGVSLRMMGKPKEAVKYYNSALRLKKDYKWAWNNKGIALMFRRKYREAEKCFKKVLEIDPDFKEAKEGLLVCGAK